MIPLLQKYSNASGASGCEQEVRDCIKDELKKQFPSIETDFMGNVYVHYNSGKKNAKKLVVSAHMDEVGFLIDSVGENGLLTFRLIGSIDPRVLVSKAVLIGSSKVPGVIGAKPIHLQKRTEWQNPIGLDSLYIDIGVSGKDAAMAHVKPGDYAVFDIQSEVQDDVIMGKAFDDRAGCAVVTEIMKYAHKQGFPVDVTAVFTVQEEVGLRGASILAERVKPDYMIGFEGTTAGDVPMKKEASPSTELRKGPALSFMDMQTIGFRCLLNRAEDVAKKNKIPYQFKRTVSGGTDIGAVHTKGGIPSMIISVPVRYIHAPKGILALSDYKHTVALAIEMIKSLKEAL